MPHKPTDTSPAPRVESASIGPVLVLGAGSIGCYLGGCLQGAGVRVVFVGRARVLEALQANGLTLTALDHRHHHIAATELELHARVPPALTPALVLLAVKSGSTAVAAADLSMHVPPGTPVVSMQNGVANVAAGRAAAPGLRWLAGMVPFNVAELGPGRFHRGTTGDLAVQEDPVLRAFAPCFVQAGLPLRFHPDLLAVQWGKLLLNLNNPVNALSGRPLREQLMDRGHRQCLAALQSEALQVLRRARITPAKVAALAPQCVPTLLRLPTPLFRLLAARMLRIDAKARSSMAEDLARGRTTEIDALCGEVVHLARQHGLQAPINARMVELVTGWPATPRAIDSRELKAALGI